MADTGDAVVNALSNAYADSLAAGARTEDIDDDALFDALDEVDDSAYRSTRLQQLSDEVKALRSLSPESGSYLRVRDERQLLALTTSEPRVVVHFAHADFARCAVMGRHLAALAARHLRTRFVWVDVGDCPFLVTRLGVQVLPCVLPVVDGVNRERVLGFEGLGGAGDDFATGALEALLRRTGVLLNVRGDGDLAAPAGRRTLMGFAEREEEYDSDE